MRKFFMVGLALWAGLSHAQVKPNDVKKAVVKSDIAKLETLRKKGDVSSVRYTVNFDYDGKIFSNISPLIRVTPLIHATILRDTNLMQYFLTNSADVNAQDARGHTALMFATALDDREMVSLLLTPNTDLTLTNDKGYSAFDYALGFPSISKNFWNIVNQTANLIAPHLPANYLIEGEPAGVWLWRGGAYTYKDNNKYYIDPIEALTKAIEQGLDIHALHKFRGYSSTFLLPLLSYAVYSGDKKAVELLLARGADINQKDQTGNPPLVYASKFYDMADYLIKKGANPKITMDGLPFWDAVLFIAIRLDSDFEEIKLIIKRGANINARDSEGYTPVMRALKNDRCGVADYLRSLGAR